MSSTSQLPLEFDHRPALTGEDFLVVDSNRDAVAWIDRWPDWPGPALALHGPAGCGKSHLAEVFRAASGARVATAADLSDAAREFSGPVIFEDGDRALGEALEAPLLHLYNGLAEAGRHMLLTGRRPPARWPVRLPDLASRLNAATAVVIEPPDDALIAAVLVKLFNDRQLRVEAGVVRFLLPRMERSFEAARRVVTATDRLALAERRRITVPLIKRVLNEITDNNGV